jgi:predicted GH43/DUF377 family glycosyl hydrolase
VNDCWRQLFQTTIDAFYTRNFAAGLDACERLLSVAGLRSEIELQTRRNLVFYAPILAHVAPSTASRPIEIPVPEGWTCYNPSIAAADEGFRLILRSANYRLDRPLRYTVHDADGIVRTTNYLLDLSPDLAIRDVQAIDDCAFRPEPPLYPVAGFEDCRLIPHDGSWWVSATVRDRDPGGVCRMALLRLDGAAAAEEHLLSDGSGVHQKNWMPIVGVASLQFVSSCSPTVVLDYDELTATVAPNSTRPAPLIARQFHGGSQLIPVDDGHLCVVHEVAHFDDGGRLYTHRWVWFDAERRLSRISPPFLLKQRGVEFTCGLARLGDDLLVSYGVWDREAWVSRVPLAEVLPLLAPPLDPEDVEDEMCAASRTSGRVEAFSDRELEAPLEMERRAEVASEPLGGGITPFPRWSPSIVSTTLTGNSDEIIGDALRSVIDWVDWCLVIDTGITDDTLEIASEIAGDKLMVRTFPWRDDFADARNFALQAAAELGADWAVNLDTDERLVLSGIDIRTLLKATTADTLHVIQLNGMYGKERFFRLPARGRYVGPTHEAFIRDSGESGTLDGVRFDELWKTVEQYRQKAERDIAILSRHTADHPHDPRWFYYLGDSLAGLDRNDEAIAAFRRCASLRGWDEEGAWALYRAAECFLKLDRPVDAIDSCATGMARHAGLAELPWLAAYASWQADHPAQAVYWARLAIAMGHFTGTGGSVPRVGFRHPPALWEGPYDVLRFALRRLGDDAGADEAERLFQAAKTAREAAGF